MVGVVSSSVCCLLLVHFGQLLSLCKLLCHSLVQSYEVPLQTGGGGLREGGGREGRKEGREREREGGSKTGQSLCEREEGEGCSTA